MADGQKNVYDVVGQMAEAQSPLAQHRMRLETGALASVPNAANEITINAYTKAAVKTEKLVQKNTMNPKHAKRIMKARKKAMKNTGILHKKYFAS